MAEHGWYDKRFIYDESIHMPLIIRYPSVKGDQRCDKMVLNVDLPETFLDIAGVPIPEDMQGESMLPLLSDPDLEDGRDAMYYHFYESREDSPLPVRNHYGIRTDRYKLIHFYSDEHDHWELYDLEEDPYEMTNLVGEKKYSRIKRTLITQLQKERRKLKDSTGAAL